VLIRPRLRWSQYCRRHNCVGQLVDSPLALPNSVRPWAFPSYQSQTKIRGSERPWNCVGCKSAGPDRYLRPPARRHRLAGVWNSRDRRKVILFSGSAMEIPKQLIDCLNQNNVQYEILHHSKTVTAQRIAQAEHVKGRHQAKVVMLKSGDQHLIAVLAA